MLHERRETWGGTRRSRVPLRSTRRGELRDLFVDEGAIGAVAWIAGACLALQQVPAGAWSGPILFADLSVIFLLTTRAKP